MSSKTPKSTLYQALPDDMVPGPSVSYEAGIENLNNLLKDLPKTDQKKAQSELKKSFYLDKDLVGKKKPQQQRKKKQFLTRKERIKLNALKLPKEGWKYDELELMRNMWTQYMRQNLDSTKVAPSFTDPEWSSFSLIVARAELVGAEIEVVRSKLANQVGMRGTIVLETKMTFQIVTPQSKLKILLKENSVFEFRVDNLIITVFGKHLIMRPSERSVKKIKNVVIPEL